MIFIVVSILAGIETVLFLIDENIDNENVLFSKLTIDSIFYHINIKSILLKALIFSKLIYIFIFKYEH